MVSVGRAAERCDAALRNIEVDEVVGRICSRLRHQVTELRVDAAEGQSLTVTGRSRTYYGKQLVTHAFQAAAPGIALRNEVVVG